MTIAKTASLRQPTAVPVLGGAIALGGLAMMGGWLFEQEAVVRMFPGFLMVFNTALGFAAAGLALAIGALAPAARPAVRASAGMALAGLGGQVLVQYVFGISLGIDWPGLHGWLIDPGANPHPGRMSPATSATFAGAGAVSSLPPGYAPSPRSCWCAR